ncbi:MAG: sigma-54-dependent Fis family transcriptional regulator [bacterium]|nr:sigma-54-dependent Fis family transcriptional regulator [bacterium]
MKRRPHILITEDDTPLRESLRNVLKRHHYKVSEAGTINQALRHLQDHFFDLILLDLSLPDGSGLDLLRKVDLRYRNRIIVVSGTGTIDTAVEAMRRGALDFLEKPVDRDVLLVSVKKSIDLNRDLDDYRKLKDELKDSPTFKRIIFKSRAMAEVIKKAKSSAQSNKTVLITGETGTGKELLAQAIHNSSERKKKAFVTVNCAAIPINLAESELFGFERGAFTGAENSYPGKFLLANSGTIFLDEVGELNPEIQPKLLRVLESGEITSLKSRQSTKLDIRVIAATNRLLDGVTRESNFRSDLYYRLEEITIRIPALRERTGDILPLVRHFTGIANITHSKRVEGFSPEAEQLLMGYHWPGNVREIKNTVDETVAFIRGNEIKARDLPPKLRKGRKAAALENTFLSLQEVEKNQVEQALRMTGHNIQRSSKLLGIGRPALYRKIEKYGFEKVGK